MGAARREGVPARYTPHRARMAELVDATDLKSLKVACRSACKWFIGKGMPRGGLLCAMASLPFVCRFARA